MVKHTTCSYRQTNDVSRTPKTQIKTFNLIICFESLYALAFKLNDNEKVSTLFFFLLHCKTYTTFPYVPRELLQNWIEMNTISIMFVRTTKQHLNLMNEKVHRKMISFSFISWTKKSYFNFLWFFENIWKKNIHKRLIRNY